MVGLGSVKGRADVRMQEGMQNDTDRVQGWRGAGCNYYRERDTPSVPETTGACFRQSEQARAAAGPAAKQGCAKVP